MGFPGIGSWVDRWARRAPNDFALVVDEAPLSYLDLSHRTSALAGELARHGVGPGDRVAFHGRNDSVGLSSLFATAGLGAVWVPIHPRRPEREVESILEDSGARVVIRDRPSTHPSTGLLEVEADELPSDREAPSTPFPREAEPDDLVILAYTSGTTGSPKGVMLSHANVAWNVVQMLAACAFSREDRSLAAAPFTRMGGLGVTVLPTLFAGGTVVVPGTGGGQAVLDTIERSRISVVFANPDLLEDLVLAPGWRDADLSSVRTGVVGGGLTPEALLRAYVDRGVLLRHGYGLTEAAPVVSLLDEREAGRRLDSVGKPLPFVDVRVTRVDGSPCDPGEVGSWWIRGPNVCAGYWGDDPIRDADGWFPTGDVGSIDADGYLTFVDRATSAMTIDGVVVYPATIERALYGTPAVTDVAAVELEGRLVAAVVVEVDGTLVEPLPDLTVPYELRRVEAIPRNAAGKVLRTELRELVRSTASSVEPVTRLDRAPAESP